MRKAILALRFFALFLFLSLITPLPVHANMITSPLALLIVIPYIIYYSNALIESIIAVIFLVLNKLPKTIAVSVFFANLFSWPITVGIAYLIEQTLPSAFFGKYIGILFAEIIAVFFETGWIYFFDRRIISFKKTLLLCTITNATSFLTGRFIFRTL